MNRLFGKKPEQPKPVETPKVVETHKPVGIQGAQGGVGDKGIKGVTAPVAKPVEIQGVTAPVTKSVEIQGSTFKGATAPASIKEKVKEGEKWLKHVTTGEMAKLHALYTTTRKNPKTGLDEKVTVCTEVDCEKNKPQ
jgi:hypothetical protein